METQRGAHIRRDGDELDAPIAYWRLGETTNTTARDYVGGHDGQYTNVVPGQPGYSLLDPDTAAAFGPARDSYVADIQGIDFSAGSSAIFSTGSSFVIPPARATSPNP